MIPLHILCVQGVLADRKAHKSLERAQYLAKQQQRQQILARIAEGAKVSNTAVSTNPSALHPLVKKIRGDSDEEESDEEDDLDEDFMQAFRAKRLQGTVTIVIALK